MGIDVADNIKIVMAAIDEIERNRTPGCVVECGVYKGDSLAAILSRLGELGSRRKVYGFDSFCGLPHPGGQDAVNSGDPEIVRKTSEGYFGDTSVEEVRKRLSQYDSVELIQGWFKDTLCEFSEPIALLFLDCDFYDSYKIVLADLWPLVASDGIVIFDEYESVKYPGPHAAVDEFFANKPDKPIYDTRFLAGRFKRWFVRKK